MRISLIAALAGAGLGATGLGAMALGDEPQAAATYDMTASATGSSTSASGGSSENAPPQELDAKPWKFVIAPYLWVPAQHGHVQSGIARANVSMTVGDTWNAIWDNFQFAGCLHMEAVHDRWTIFGDAMYLHLGNEVKNLPITADFKQGIFELGGTYAVFDGALPGAASDSTVRVRLEPLAGVRVWYIDSTITGPFQTRGPNDTWVDGFGGVRGELAFNETFSLTGRVDVGTGMSELTWNALTMLNINFNKNIGIFAGWRWLSDNYSKGSGRDRFEYDMMLSGPFAGLKITF
ncbi:MAG: hypothetical protein U0573_13420 [Phycisphaerales bacterium]|nr:hypothetical protein [Planctomycetota bacterium]